MTAPPAIGSLFAVEIPITNLSRSQTFYSELFDWQFAPNPLPKGTDNIRSLHFFTDASNSIKGALLLLEEGVLPSAAGKAGDWSMYPTFIVSDVGEAIKKTEDLSGKVKTPRTEIPNDMGVLDPDNNIIGVWSQK